MREKILAIDDDEALLQLIQHILESTGYEVITAHHAQSGIELFEKNQPDLVILDVMMPQIDGWEVCRRIRSISTVPIIMLTALRWHQDVIRGLNIGADDYIVKPFHPEELQARIEALLRRTGMPPTASGDLPLRFRNELVIDPTNRQVMVRGKVVNLTPTEYELLLFLAKHPNRVLPTAVIFDNVWPYYADASLDSVKWYVWRLRNKIEEDPQHPRYILTEHGIGYRFAAR